MGTTLDLLLINPGGRRGIYQGLANDYSALEPPWYSAATAGLARRKGYRVEIIDANALDMNTQETAEKARELRPKLIALIAYGQQPSDSSQRMTSILEQCKALKSVYPESKIIVTGLYPSALPEKTLKDVACDYVAQGEGFLTTMGMLQGTELDKIPGLARKINGKIIANPKPANIQNLDEVLPDVAWDLLPMGNYKAHNWHSLQNIEQRQPYASLYSSLGCIFNCSFCCIRSPFGGSNIRYWKPETTLQQIDTLVKNYGVKNLKFIDEMFVLHKGHVQGIADGIIARGYDLNIWAYARVDTVKDKRLLEKMKRAGFNWLALGIESGSKHVRDGVEKGRFGEEQIISNVRNVHEAGINIIGNYIFGLPDDTHETMQQTLSLAKTLKCEWANFYSAMAYPGSDLYPLAKQKGIPLPDDESVRGCIGYSQHAFETLPMPTDTLSAAEVLRFRDQAHLSYFSDPSYLRLIEQKFGQKASEHIRSMNTHTLKRKLLGD